MPYSIFSPINQETWRQLAKQREMVIMNFKGVYVRERSYEDNRRLLPLFFDISTHFCNLTFYFKDSPFIYTLHFLKHAFTQ